MMNDYHLLLQYIKHAQITAERLALYLGLVEVPAPKRGKKQIPESSPELMASIMSKRMKTAYRLPKEK